MSTNHKRPDGGWGTDRGKDLGPDTEPFDDGRENGSLRHVLLCAPPDADWETIWQVYVEEVPPQDAWPDARDITMDDWGGGER